MLRRVSWWVRRLRGMWAKNRMEGEGNCRGEITGSGTRVVDEGVLMEEYELSLASLRIAHPQISMMVGEVYAS